MLQFARLAIFTGVMALLVTLGTEEVLAQKKKDEKAKTNENAATPADYLQIQGRKEMTGTIVGMGANSLTIKLEFPHLEPNPNYKQPTGKAAGNNPQLQQLQRYQQLMKQQQQAMNAKSPQERQKALMRYQMEMAKFQQQQQAEYFKLASKAGADQKNPAKAGPNDPFQVVTTSKEYELNLEPKAEIRKTFLAMEYDDVGKMKVYTEKEKAELRGTDKTKPGYKAKLDEIAPGTEAKLTLTPVKAKKKDGKGEDEGVGNVEKPTVNAILLTRESPNSSMVGADPKKKKDNK